ncbi:membranebound O-acyltransferase domain containing protein [Entamoeba histolytica KU27]|nr:membranebound O-acyltransferase domain containing protein [Entamoeba histolytica KU27]
MFSNYSLADDWVEPLSSALNVPLDQVKYFSNAVLAAPICFGLRYLPNNQNIKHIVYGTLGMVFSYLLFGMEFITVFFTSIPVYLIMKYNKTQKAANICFIITFGYLLYRHIYLYFNMYLVWTLEFTTTHMIITLKLTAFAFSVANSFKKELTPYLEAHKINKYPSIIEFYGFIFFYPGLFSGPSLEYRDYMSFIDMSRFNLIKGKELPKIPILKFLEHYIGGIIIYFIYAYINSNPLPNPEYYILEHPETCSIWWKLLTIWWTVSTIRLKYYGTWKLTESLGEISGCGYTGTTKEGKDEFLLYRNVSIIEFEVCRSCKVNMDLWNTYVQKWLKNYVYVSMIGTPLERYKTSLTMAVCAFWHGVYPGYYMSFFVLGFDKDLSNLIYKRLDPYMRMKFGEGSIVWNGYDILLRIFNHWHLNYAVYPFMRFELIPSLIVVYRTYFLGYLIPLILYLWLTYYPPHLTQEKIKKEELQQQKDSTLLKKED